MKHRDFCILVGQRLKAVEGYPTGMAWRDVEVVLRVVREALLDLFRDGDDWSYPGLVSFTCAVRDVGDGNVRKVVSSESQVADIETSVSSLVTKQIQEEVPKWES